MYVVPYVLVQTFQYQIAKDGLNYGSPFVLMGIRFLVASLLLFGLARKFKPIFNKDTLLLSLFMWVSTSFWAFGLEYVSAADSAVLCFTMPLFAIPISSVILSENPSISEWVGAVVGFLGVLVYSLALANHALTLLGAVLTLVNAVFWAMATVYYRKLRYQEPTMTVATQLFIVALLLLVCAPLNYKLVIARNFWVDLAYLSILSGAVNFSLWNGLVRSQKIGKSSTLVYLIPVTATLAQSVQNSAIPDPVSLTGLILMTLGIYIANGTVALQTNAKRLSLQILRRSEIEI